MKYSSFEKIVFYTFVLKRFFRKLDIPEILEMPTK